MAFCSDGLFESRKIVRPGTWVVWVCPVFLEVLVVGVEGFRIQKNRVGLLFVNVVE